MTMKRDNSPSGRRYQRDRLVAAGEMLEARPGETMRLGRGVAEVIPARCAPLTIVTIFDRIIPANRARRVASSAVSKIAMAFALGAMLAGAATAGTLPGEIVGATIDLRQPLEAHYLHCAEGDFGYAVLPMTWRDPRSHKRAPGYAVLPAETEEGQPVNARQAAALYWWTVERDPRHQGRHFGIYRSSDAAHAAMPALAAHCHDAAAPASDARDDDAVMLAEGWNEAKGSKSRHGGGKSRKGGE